MSQVHILKFGGTSVGSGERIRHVAQIIVSAASLSAEAFPVVVVSAMSGVTDSLLRIARLVCFGQKGSVTQELHALKQRHIQAATEAIMDSERREALLVDLEQHFHLLEEEIVWLPHFYQAQPYSADASPVAAWGERLSALLLAAAVEDVGVRATALREEIIITREQEQAEPAAFGVVIGADPLLEATRVHVALLLHPLLEQKIVPIIPGFIGRTSSGNVKTLGRGGSDLSATVIGAVLDECCEVVIFTDVDGVMSADPRLVGEQNVLLFPHLSYATASRLARLGAKVLHPQTLAPIIARRLPIQVRNTFRPYLQGTVIGPEEERECEATALVLQRHLAHITVESLLPDTPAGTAVMALACAMGEGVKPIAICSAFDQHLSFLVEEQEAQAAVAAFQQQGGWRVTCRDDLCACVCLGSDFSSVPSHSARAIDALARAGIELIAHGTTEFGMLLIVEGHEGEWALRCLHDALIAPLQLVAVGS